MNIRDRLSPQIKASLAFVIASTITQGLTLLTTPLFVRIMSTEEIGKVSNFNSWVVLIGALVNMGLYSNSYVVALHDYQDRKHQYTSCALSVSIISSLLFSVVCFLFPSVIEDSLNVSHNLMLLMCMGFLFLPATNFWLTRQRYEYHYISVLIVSVASAVLSTLLSVIAVLLARENGFSTSEARVLGSYLVNVPVGAFFTIWIIKKGKKAYDQTFLKFILKVNTPMIVHTIAKNLLDVSDRVMIAAIVGDSEAGIYGTLYSISTLIMILWNAVNLGITPFMFSEMSNIKERKEPLRKYVNSILFLFFVFSIIYILVAPEFIRIFTTKEYMQAINIVAPIVSGTFIAAVYSLIGNVLLFNKKTVGIMISTLFSGAVNILLNWILIPVCGYQAAAYTTVIGYFILAIFMYIFMRRITNETSDFFDIRFAVALIFLNILLGIACTFAYPLPVVRYGILLLVLVILFLNKRKVIGLLKR